MAEAGVCKHWGGLHYRCGTFSHVEYASSENKKVWSKAGQKPHCATYLCLWFCRVLRLGKAGSYHGCYELSPGTCSLCPTLGCVSQNSDLWYCLTRQPSPETYISAVWKLCWNMKCLSPTFMISGWFLSSLQFLLLTLLKTMWCRIDM